MIDIYLGITLLLIFSFSASFLLEMMVLPRVIYIAKKKRLYDVPNGRKSHALLVPRLAGTSFFPILLVVFFVAALIFFKFGPLSTLLHFESSMMKSFGMLAGNMVLLAVGVKDDIVGSRYLHKMIAQIIAAALLVSGGLYINDFNGLFGIEQIPIWIGIPFTILLIVFITNAINLIDGIDGLASGISMVALTAFAVLFFMRGMYLYTVVATILLGILGPFYYYNVFFKKRKVFMGDTGSLTLGYQLAYLGIHFSMNNSQDYSTFPAPTILALAILFIPIFDALRVMTERALAGKSMFMPDRRHLHHKLLDLGFSHRKARLSIVSGVTFLIIFNYGMFYMVDVNVIFVIDMIIWLGFIKILNIIKRKKGLVKITATV